MAKTLRPLARGRELIIETAGDELLVFDKQSDRAYVLNPTAAAVWRASDGTRTAQEIAGYLSQENPTSEQTVLYALGQLQDLLEEPVEVPHTLAGMSRRQFLKRAGAMGAAAAVPVVVSLVAPAAAHAQSGTQLWCCTYGCPGGGSVTTCQLDTGCNPFNGECALLPPGVTVSDCSTECGDTA
jgi:hypothetical protein